MSDFVRITARIVVKKADADQLEEELKHFLDQAEGDITIYSDKITQSKATRSKSADSLDVS